MKANSAKLFSVELVGLEGALVEVEADTRMGLPAFIVVGLPDAAVQEARHRVKSAIKNSGFPFPRTVTVVNLAPADLKKVGPRYDLPIALGILANMDVLSLEGLSDTAVLGELALNGEVRPLSGVLSSVEFAKKAGFKKIILPKDNAREASLISGITLLPVGHLKEAVMLIAGELYALPVRPPVIEHVPESACDMAVIKGQYQAKRALEIAAAGGHNVLMRGAPGAGKTMLARAMTGILPSMSESEMLEVTKLYSVAGLLPKSQPIITRRPFRAVHHTASAVSLVGGGATPLPGEISLAHRGVLFMDEIGEFPSHVLQVLRQPMEDHFMTVSRARGSVTYPSQFALVGATNPCPCGFFDVPNAPKKCTCLGYQIKHYQKKLSGPLLDRIDIHLDIEPVDFQMMKEAGDIETSAVIQARVEKAARRQRARFRDLGFQKNAEIPAKHLEAMCPMEPEAERMLQQAMTGMGLSARGYSRVVKLARTIADLAESDVIRSGHVGEAINLRNKLSEN